MSRRQRTLLLFLSASAYTAWFSGLGDRLEAQSLERAETPSLTVSASRPRPAVEAVVVRDPFDEDDVRAPLPSRPSAPSSPAGAANDVVVPDIDTGAEPRAQAGATFAVRATIVGPSPVAYVASGGTMDVVRVGDSLAGRRVAKIDLHGITFGDGSRLDLPDFVATPPLPRPDRGPVSLSLDDLRRLLARPQTRAPAANPSPAPAAAPATPQPYPTPAPLATVDRAGFSAGAAPTPDLGAPTAYPIPYPYAAPVR